MNKFFWPPRPLFGFAIYIGPSSYSRYWNFYINSQGPCWNLEYEWKSKKPLLKGKSNDS